MPMIASRNEYGIDRLVVESEPQVLDLLWGRTVLLHKLSAHLAGPFAVGIADVSNVTIGERCQRLGMLLATNAAADNRYGDLVAGAGGTILSCHHRRAGTGDGGGSRDHRIFEEPTTRETWHGRVLCSKNGSIAVAPVSRQLRILLSPGRRRAKPARLLAVCSRRLPP